MECRSCGASVTSAARPCPVCNEPPTRRRGEDVESSDRPLGISILVAFGAVGVFVILALALAVSGVPAAPGWLAPFLAILALAQAAVLYGLWNLTAWGYKVAVLLYSLSIIINFFLLFVSFGSAVLTILFNGLILAYLLSKERYFTR